LVLRHPGQPRSLQILVPEDQIPPWNRRQRAPKPATKSMRGWVPTREAVQDAPPVNLYVLSVYLRNGPISEEFTRKVVNRVIEIRGDQTLADLHAAIFQAFDRWDQHAYEFQFGKRPFDPAGPNYGVGNVPAGNNQQHGDARTTKLDDLGLKKERVFGYWFDFGDDWYHQVQVERIERAIPTVTYPRVIKRVGKSPPQYLDEPGRGSK
jgi:hypothetical protein